MKLGRLGLLCLLRPRLLQVSLLRLRLGLLQVSLLRLLPAGLLRIPLGLRPLPGWPSRGTGRRYPRLARPRLLPLGTWIAHRARLNRAARPGCLGRI